MAGDGDGGGWAAWRGRMAKRREAAKDDRPEPVVHVPAVPHPVTPPVGPGGEPIYPARPAHASEAVPWTLRVAAEGIWRLLVVGAGLWVLLQVVGTLRIVALAFVAALLISALLQPTVSWLRRHGVPRGLATAITFLGGLVGIALVAWFVVWQVSTNLNQVTDHVQQGIAQIRHWLETGPMHLTDKQINDFANQLTKVVGTNSDQITSFGFSTVSVVVEIVTGVFLAAFCTFFLLYDGEKIWGWVLRLMPVRSRIAATGAGPRAWATLTAYVRGTVLVAFIDSLSIGIGIYLLGVPLAMPIAVLIFLGAFVPLVGALVTGTIAVLIGLVTHGVITAALVLAVLLGVQQIEGHLLQPLILGRAVRIHPLAVILAVACGSIVGGIGGAIVAVPLVAVTNTVVGYLRQRYHVDEDVRAALAAAAAPE
ncbi:AI-2E family transporter [Streptacidiphilus rugosus]|uniref:AI-2E family transporter n=1 Tax=Streptacidiphilus rugosus TaxID=405783 RepID=UPI00068D9B5C|nr:AI-2E family transporter [Streptacidiphilus rugosus]